jgi:energy-coupling factor transporter ATP-binding protein EcfA2
MTGGALMQEPDLLLADEPTSSLDLKTSIEILEIISRSASESSIPVIVNNHNVELAHRYAARLMGSAASSLAAFLSARIGPHSRQYKCPSIARTVREKVLSLARRKGEAATIAIVHRPGNDEPFAIRLTRRQRDIFGAAGGTEPFGRRCA